MPDKRASRRERRQAQQDASKHREVPVPPSMNRFTRQNILSSFALGLLVLVSYLPAMLWGGFVWDDRILTDAEPIREVSGLWQIWFSPSAIAEEAHYWPLVYTTFWLKHKLWEFDPTGYHVVNVLLHLANVLLIWHLLRRLAVPGAWMAAAVFAVHPLHVESVAWVIERKDVLSGLFYLAAVLAWLRFVEKPRRGWYVCSLALYSAGMLSKSIVVTLPVALLIWHWWKQGRVTSIDLLRLVPFSVVGIVITVGDLSFYQSVEPLSLDYSFIERTLIAARALWFYAGKLLWPSELAVIYPLWDIRVSDPLAWGYLIAAVVLAVALWHFRPQLGRGPLAGALFYAVTLSPVLGFVDYGYMQFSFVADRFQYLAGIGIMAVAIGAATYGVGQTCGKRVCVVVVAVALVVLGLLTWRQTSIYRDNETLNRHIISLNPQARSAHINLSKALYEQARYEEALEVARVAIAKRPDSSKAYATLGEALNKLGRSKEAETHLRRAIALNPQEQNAHLNLGVALYRQGRYDPALEATRVALAQHPNYDTAHHNLGLILKELGRFEEAEQHLRRAIALSSNHTKGALYALATLRIEQQRYNESLELLQHLIGIEPGHAKGLDAMGIALFYLGKSDEALQHFDQALLIDPTLETAQANREAVLKALEATQN